MCVPDTAHLRFEFSFEFLNVYARETGLVVPEPP